MKTTVGVIGNGSWGTALAIHLANKDIDTFLWSRSKDQIELMNDDRENKKYLPGVKFPEKLNVTGNLIYALNCKIILCAIPTQFIRSTLSNVPDDLFKNKILISASKGIEVESLLRISEIFVQTHQIDINNFICLSGPSHAEEMSRGIPTTLVSASLNEDIAKKIVRLFSNENLRVYESHDLIGVELGGALKNVIAVCAGIIDGVGYGDNTKAALITRGLAEITRLGISLGAEAHTFSGLAGMGDLVVTCTSKHSRNRFVGEQIGKGKKLSQIIQEMNMIAEGIATTESAFKYAKKNKVELPITNQVYEILFKDKDPKKAIYELMTRSSKKEIWV
ncbi:MAG: NAD(P)H-dependent glycerol-3-phosphate dehydrogenase [Chlorobiota bacterium]|nr:MAG: NAD(P)H-dependent glycerol-3-phosphate dehydrogenase [Chlorobiota bacterium]